jgi:hypothetical protein
VNVDIRNLYVFLLRDGTFFAQAPFCAVRSNGYHVFLGTVISIHQDADPNFGESIIKRLRHRDGLLRSNPDASLLIQSMLDLSMFLSLSLRRK